MNETPRKSDWGPRWHETHKRKNRRIPKHKAPPITESHTSDPPSDEDTFIPNAITGQHFYMDFGFVRGSKYAIKREDGGTITSKDGYNAYLIIIDRASRYSWIFPTKSKHPPIALAKKVLSKFKAKNLHISVCIDQGDELGRSKESPKWSVMKVLS